MKFKTRRRKRREAIEAETKEKKLAIEQDLIYEQPEPKKEFKKKPETKINLPPRKKPKTQNVK